MCGNLLSRNLYLQTYIGSKETSKKQSSSLPLRLLLPSQRRSVSGSKLAPNTYGNRGQTWPTSKADSVYDRADAFIDSLMGNFTSILEKTALIRASSETYSQHFALAERLGDPAKAYPIVKPVPGPTSTMLGKASWSANNT
jgi:hypothetical protein